MQLTKIILQNFRNYSKIEVSLNSDLVLILGENASGKTNFLEGIYFLSRLKSFRTPNNLLIKDQEDYFTIEGNTADAKFEATVQLNPASKKSLKINGQKTVSGLWQSFATVLFVPDDLNLFILGPKIRRKYLDETLSQINKAYAADLVSVSHILLHRSVLLSKIFVGRANAEQLDPWNMQLTEAWLRISKLRRYFLDFLQERFDKMYFQLTGFDNKFEIVYKGLKAEDDLSAVLSLLEKYREQEMRSGVNLLGPHREDFLVKKDGELNIYNCSRGELRSQILAIKLLQAEYLTTNERKPIILLDDVFSELDEERRGKLIENLAGHQIFITSTEEHHLPKLGPKVLLLKVANNQIE